MELCVIRNIDDDGSDVGDDEEEEEKEDKEQEDDEEAEEDDATSDWWKRGTDNVITRAPFFNRQHASAIFCVVVYTCACVECAFV